MTLNLAPKPYPLVDAVLQIREAIEAAPYDGEQIILRADDYCDLNEALGHVLRLRQSVGINYRTVELSATYSAHGTSLDDLDELELPEQIDNTVTTVLVTVNSDFQINSGTKISVVGTLAGQLRQLEEEHSAYIGQIIFVIDDEQRGR